MAQELDCIIRTGSFTFHFGREALGSGKDGVFLVYEPSSSSRLPASTHSPQQEMGEPQQELQTDLEKVRKEKWNYEQIADFVRKLGFMDKQKGDQNIKHFLHLSQVSYSYHTYLSQLIIIQTPVSLYRGTHDSLLHISRNVGTITTQLAMENYYSHACVRMFLLSSVPL